MWQTGTQITNHESMLDHSVVTISITNSSGEEKKNLYQQLLISSATITFSMQLRVS